MRYHPDKNDDAILAKHRFAEIQKAYIVLSNKEQRQLYDESLKYISANAMVCSPMDVLRISNQLLEYSLSARAGRGALFAYFNWVLNDDHVQILIEDSDRSINDQVIAILIRVISKMDSKNAMEAGKKLKIVNQSHTLETEIDSTIKKIIHQNNRSKWILISVLLASIVLCLFMYRYGHSNR